MQTECVPHARDVVVAFRWIAIGMGVQAVVSVAPASWAERMLTSGCLRVQRVYFAGGAREHGTDQRDW